MPKLINPYPIRLLSRTELEDAFFEAQEACQDMKEQFESMAAEKNSLLSKNERLAHRLEIAKEDTKRLRADYRQMSKKMYAGGAQVSTMGSENVQRDGQATIYKYQAFGDRKILSIQSPTPPQPPQVSSNPINSPSNASSQKHQTYSDVQHRSVHANPEQKQFIPELSAREPATVSAFPSLHIQRLQLSPKRGRDGAKDVDIGGTSKDLEARNDVKEGG
ncbi:MAG: hypothetical protein Q9226_005946 [Calogaya cf. arnoldii]